MGPIFVVAIIYSHYSTPARIDQAEIFDYEFQYLPVIFRKSYMQFVFIGQCLRIILIFHKKNEAPASLPLN